MRHLVELYGLRVASPVPLPGAPATGTGAPDVVVHFGERPPGSNEWRESGEPLLHESESRVDGSPVLIADRPAGGSVIRMRYCEGIRFHVAADGSAVWADWAPPLTADDAVTFLLGPVFGVILRQRRVLALHASAVVVDDRGWALLGPHGSGKSTLAAVCARAGCAVLTEDVLALRPQGAGWLALPAYQQVRLWEESAALVLGPGNDLAPLSATWPKRSLDLAARGLPVATEPVPLGGIFVLENFLTVGGPPTVARLSAPSALVELVANSYGNYLADGPTLGRELEALAGLARALPVWRLHPAQGADGLVATVELIRRTIAG